ncbi:MAG TPA: MMPL family transporter [Candidatus Dormibacteraeota bacterium]
MAAKKPRGRAAAPAQPAALESPRMALGALLVGLLVSAVLGYGATRLNTDASVGLLADTSSAAYRDQAAYAGNFGADPVVIELEPQPGQQLLTPQHMVGMAGMEGKLASVHGVKRVYGPGTLVNTFANEVTRRALDICGQQGQAAENAAKAAGKSSQEQQQAFDDAVRACANQIAQQYPTLGVPAVDNPSFYDEILLEPNGAVRPFWLWALPDPNHAVIQVRMSPDATAVDVRAVLDRVDSQRHRSELQGLDVHVAGAPALTVSLADSVHNSLIYLLPLTLLAMLVVTLLAIRVRLRLLAVPLAALAGLWTAGAAGWLGLPLTPATLAVLPVVLGLTTDYVIQAVNRLAEEPAGMGRLERTARAILPATGTAALATAIAVLGFALSPIPLVRQFALFMALGVVCAYVVSTVVGLPLVALFSGRAASVPAVRGRRKAAPEPAPLPASPLRAHVLRAGRLPLNVVLPLAAVGVLGWVALPLVRLETDPSQLMPPGSATLAEAQHIKDTVGLVGEIDLVLVGPDVTQADAVAWLQKATDHAASSDLKPVSGLSGFLAAFNNNQPPDAAQTQKILANIPGYFTNAVVSTDHKMARSVFGITRLTSVADDQRLAARLQSGDSPPAGYRAYPAGLAVIAAQSLQQLSGDQLKLNLLALAVVLVVLLLAYRHPLPAGLAVLPTVVAAGWATGLLALLQVRSSPITILLAGVVVAFATEFSVLWLARYRSERLAGAAAEAAAFTASERVGPAIVASALALAVGFLVLAVSPVPMVRGFGIVCGLDMVLATAAVLVLLPPLARSWLR